MTKHCKILDSLLNGELDIASLESFCSGTDGYVHTWYDQSGNGSNATQTAAADQPKIVHSGSTIMEGTKPSMDFEGDFMNGSTGYSFTDFAAFSCSFIMIQLKDTQLLANQIITLDGDNTSMASLVLEVDYLVQMLTPQIHRTQDYTLLSTLSYGNSGYTFVDGVQEATASVIPAADTSATFQIAKVYRCLGNHTI